LFNSLLDNQDAVRDFLSLTGGSILYCLSALSIVYGITQIIGPPLANSDVLRDILPCVFVLNGYELALLGVLLLIVMWRHVTDDAISLVILVAIFLIGSGMTLGVVAPSGLDICLLLGIACVLLGLVKVYALKRFISLQFGIWAILGMIPILAWNFLASALMARPLLARAATDEIRRTQWLVSWLVLLLGTVLILIEATRRTYPTPGRKDRHTPFLYRPPMAMIFFLVLIVAAGLHQYGTAYMFAVDYGLSDFIPLIAVGALLFLELLRSFEKPLGGVEAVVTSIPLALTLMAVVGKSTVAAPASSPEMLWSPPVMLGLTGLTVLWLSYHHRWPSLFFVALAYALGVLLVLGKPHELNWQLGGVGLIVVLAAFAIMKRNIELCFVTVLAIAVGLGITDAFEKFVRAHHMTPFGAAAAVSGLGTMVICLTFGRRTHRLITLFGAAALITAVFSCLPKPLHWTDLVLLGVTAVLSVALWFRTREFLASLLLWAPLTPKGYRFATEMSAWSFVLLSFLLLFGGACVSLFCKRRPQPAGPPVKPDSDLGP